MCGLAADAVRWSCPRRSRRARRAVGLGYRYPEGSATGRSATWPHTGPVAACLVDEEPGPANRQSLAATLQALGCIA